VRTEECVNYFKSDYAPPPQDSAAAFAIHTELAPSSFAHDSSYRLLKVGLKGREVSREKRKSCSLVFVVDTSGSMRQQNRLELVKDALRLLAAELDEGDTVGIVSFDVDARVVLDPTAASKREVILDAISRLQPNRNTNVNAGLTLGYELAARAFLPGGSNRVILCSDGVANTGLTVDPQVMGQNVRAQRLKGIYLTSVGVGMGNHNDTLMEQLADQGDGQCVYVDRLDEAKKVFVDSLTGTLEAIARDVKVQVEFDKDKVVRYRQLGYENRALADAAFRDNTVDAGEVGSGHEVTCLYEVKCAPGAQGRLATVRVRYLTVDQKDGVEHREPVEIEHAVEASSERASFAQASARFRLSACVAEFAEVLRDSYWARGADLLATAKVVEEQLAAGELGQEQDVVELVALMKKADALVRMRLQSADAVAQVEDALRENSYLRSRLEDFQRRDSTEDLRHLDDLRRQNDELRRRLEGMLEKTFR
jgi:Ca-activated chloride channel family protein